MQHVQIISIGVVVTAILGSSYFILEKKKHHLNFKEYKGYLVNDEEMTGFFPCGGGPSYGLSWDHEVNLRAIYQKYKTKIREPIYFEFTARETEIGDYGVGLSGQKSHSYLRVSEIKNAQRHLNMGCGAKYPFRKIVVKFD